MFKEDLKFGHKYEKKTLRYFNYDEYELPQERKENYDIMFTYNGEKTKVEVKADRLSYKTGNIAIEHTCNLRPSGISTTSADYYIYYIINPDEKFNVYKIPLDKLKIICKGKRSICGGDRGKSIMYLLPLTLVEEFRIVKSF